MSLVPVAWTNDSSTCSKSSLVNCGYISDDFLAKFVSKLERRSPLINRGYFIRTWAFENVVRYFLGKHASNVVQIVNLGAGYDTLCLRLAKENLLSNCLKFVDVDQVPVVRKKHQILSDISNWPSLIEDDNARIVHCCRENYSLLGCDLRSGRLYDSLKQKCQLNESLPTLFIAECVLNYLQPDEANTVIRIVSQRFANGYFLAYEQIYPDDAFGQFMVEHFMSINSPLRHIGCYRTSSSQEIRFSALGFGSTKTVDMLEIYRKSLTVEEKLRIESLEPFDEFEMWHLKCTHYVLTFAATQQPSNFFNSLIDRLNLSSFSKSRMPVADYSRSIRSNILEQKPTVRRFGHRCTSMKHGERSIFIIIGGYGQCPLRNSGHKRLDSLICMDSVNFDSLTNVHHPLFARCYYSMVKLDDRRLFIFGGRRSPVKALNDAFTVELGTNGVEEDSVNFKICSVKYDTEVVPRGRWRHSSCVFTNGRIAVIGGLAPENVILDDFWIFDLHSNSWEDMPGMPYALHSHTCHCFQGKIFVIGGMREATDSFNSRVFMFDKSWSILDGECTGIYGHTSHVIDENQATIMIVGGIMDDGRSNVNIFFIRLMKNTLEQYCRTILEKTFTVQNSNDMMLIGHDSTYIPENERMILFGGGGNCFSFGTYFNDHVVLLNLNVTE